TGAEVLCPHFLALLVSALCKAEQFDEGLLVLEEALSIASRNGERCYEAELYRLKGELLLLKSEDQFKVTAAGSDTIERPSSSRPADAERCFKKSLEIARQQKARSLELRAALSLARLSRSTRIALEPIYS